MVIYKAKIYILYNIARNINRLKQYRKTRDFVFMVMCCTLHY